MADRQELGIRKAETTDLEGIVAVLADDAVGQYGDAWSEANRRDYERGFAAVTASPDNQLFVAEQAGRIVGFIQITFVPLISYRGALRCVFESVFVSGAERGKGVGAAMIAFGETLARTQGARFISLSSNKRRDDAHRFYERHGFARVSEGFRKTLD